MHRSSQETSYGDLVPGEGIRGPRRSSIDSLDRDLTLRSSLDTFESVRILQLLQRTCQGHLSDDLLHRCAQGDLAESDLVSLLFTSGVALVLLACSH